MNIEQCSSSHWSQDELDILSGIVGAGNAIVYIVKAHDKNLFKVGYTKSIVQRMSIMRSNSPGRIVLWRAIETTCPKEIEAVIHRRLTAYRRHGEWFEIEEEELIQILKTVWVSEFHVVVCQDTEYPDLSFAIERMNTYLLAQDHVKSNDRTDEITDVGIYRLFGQVVSTLMTAARCYVGDPVLDKDEKRKKKTWSLRQYYVAKEKRQDQQSVDSDSSKGSIP